MVQVPDPTQDLATFEHVEEKKQKQVTKKKSKLKEEVKKVDPDELLTNSKIQLLPEQELKKYETK